MNRTFTFAAATIALLSCAVAVPTNHAVAQEKQHVSFKSPAESSKYTQQLNVDVGDAPNHIVRVFEIHHTYANDAPIILNLSSRGNVPLATALTEMETARTTSCLSWRTAINSLPECLSLFRTSRES
jgi:hypothetical protein